MGLTTPPRLLDAYFGGFRQAYSLAWRPMSPRGLAMCKRVRRELWAEGDRLPMRGFLYRSPAT